MSEEETSVPKEEILRNSSNTYPLDLVYPKEFYAAPEVKHIRKGPPLGYPWQLSGRSKHKKGKR